jgi:hypothetical protein
MPRPLPWLEVRTRLRRVVRPIGTMRFAQGEFEAVAVMACADGVPPWQSRMEAVADEMELDDV